MGIIAMMISYKAMASPLLLYEQTNKQTNKTTNKQNRWVTFLLFINNKWTNKQTNKHTVPTNKTDESGYLLTFLHRYPVAAVMCDVLRATNRQKVQRVILATFRVRDGTSSTPATLSCQCPRTYCSLTVYTHLITCFCLCMLLFIYMYRSLVKECPPSKERPPPTCT